LVEDVHEVPVHGHADRPVASRLDVGDLEAVVRDVEQRHVVPDSADPLVPAHQIQIVGQRLCHEHPVEGIVVDLGELVQEVDVALLDRESAPPRVRSGAVRDPRASFRPAGKQRPSIISTPKPRWIAR
jgi:hypothetical protein